MKKQGVAVWLRLVAIIASGTSRSGGGRAKSRHQYDVIQVQMLSMPKVGVFIPVQQVVHSMYDCAFENEVKPAM